MRTETHTPNLNSAGHNNKGDVTYNSSCSCNGWLVVGYTAADARAAHAVHLQAVAGPEAQARREDQ